MVRTSLKLHNWLVELLELIYTFSDAKETPVKDEEDPKTTPKDDEEEDPTITPKPSQTSKDDEEESDSSKAASGTKTTRTTRIPFNSPAGRIDMKDPSIFDPMRFYPLSQGDPITWVYNMTGVLASPTAINIEAFCPSQQRYYTIASNYSAAETEVVWDVEEYQSTSALLA